MTDYTFLIIQQVSLHKIKFLLKNVSLLFSYWAQLASHCL
jgi:hypothetical protein